MRSCTRASMQVGVPTRIGVSVGIADGIAVGLADGVAVAADDKSQVVRAALGEDIGAASSVQPERAIFSHAACHS